MNLWATEQSRKDFYIDLFSEQYHDPIWLKKTHEDIKEFIEAKIAQQKWQKNDSTAALDRELGNAFFFKKMYHVALEYYNKCLCFAENGSDKISLAYSNRSACFFNMGMYANSLIDIKLAIENGYPETQIDKLTTRRDDCYRHIAAGKGVAVPEPKLDFNAIPGLPYLAETVKYDINHNNKICFVANDDLKVGKVIVLEPSYFGESYLGKYSQCNICMKRFTNLVPCGSCTVSMICSGSCMKETELHDLECAIKPYPIITNSHEINYQMPLIRSISMATKLFPNINGLMAFVRNSLSKTLYRESIDIPDPKKKYGFFLKLHANKMAKEDIPVAYSYYTTMMNQTTFSTIFKTSKQKRFLQHLIMQHFLIMNGGAMNHRSQYRTGLEPTPYEIHLNILPTLFQHSCEPNVMFLLENGSIKGVVLRSIQPGDILTTNRLGIVPEYRTNIPKLLAHIGSVCRCDRCQSQHDDDDSIPENKYIQWDPDFIKINVNKSHEVADYNTEEAKELETTCVFLLKKYGRVQWCSEIDIISRIYRLSLIHRNLFFESPIYYLFRQ